MIVIVYILLVCLSFECCYVLLQETVWEFALRSNAQTTIEFLRDAARRTGSLEQTTLPSVACVIQRSAPEDKLQHIYDIDS